MFSPSIILQSPGEAGGAPRRRWEDLWVFGGGGLWFGTLNDHGLCLLSSPINDLVREAGNNKSLVFQGPGGDVHQNNGRVGSFVSVT